MNSFEEHKNYLIYLGDEVIFRATREMPTYRRNLSLFIEPKNQIYQIINQIKPGL